MYPRQFLDTFWSPEIRDQVFVAMTFDEKFDYIYNDIIEPACSTDCGLPSIRIDYRRGGDSIITQILDGIAHSRLIIAEISTLQKSDPKSRNGNVMWEVGVAHAFRQPDEVILLRSDDDPLLFDIGPIRVHRYADTNRNQARKELSKIIKDRLASIEYQKSMLVERALRSLNPGALSALLQAPYTDMSKTFTIKPTMGAQQIWPKLFELGIVAWALDAIDREIIEKIKKGDLIALNIYKLTPFGKVVLDRLVKTVGDKSAG
jgi:hypothetical protein